MKKDRPILEPSELDIRIKDCPDIYIDAFVDLLEQLREQTFAYGTAPEASKDPYYVSHCNGGAYYLDVVITGLLQIRSDSKG